MLAESQLNEEQKQCKRHISAVLELFLAQTEAASGLHQSRKLVQEDWGNAQIFNCFWNQTLNSQLF